MGYNFVKIGKEKLTLYRDGKDERLHTVIYFQKLLTLPQNQAMGTMMLFSRVERLLLLFLFWSIFRLPLDIYKNYFLML